MPTEAAPQQPRLEATAQGVAGDTAVIAYSVTRVVSGPNGEGHQAFLLVSRDAGANWSCWPLARTVGSCLRYWGFPVWPPEQIDAIALQRERVRITFRDEWVPFEPGGESLWIGSSSSRLWTVGRIRLMNYESGDSPRRADPIAVTLPDGFLAPPAPLLEQLASRLASDVRKPTSQMAIWALVIPVGIVVALLGPRWWLLPAVVLYLFGLEVASILLERRRLNRVCRNLVG